MQIVERVGRVFVSVSEFYREINPSTLTGAIDIIVVEDAFGHLSSTPFHVRFGKLQVFLPQDKIVEVSINGSPPIESIRMKVGEAGECFFVIETLDPVPEEYATSPLIQARQPSAEVLASLSHLSLGDKKKTEPFKTPNKFVYPLSDSEVDYANKCTSSNQYVTLADPKIHFSDTNTYKLKSSFIQSYDEIQHTSLSDSELYSYDFSGEEPQQQSSFSKDNAENTTTSKEISSFWSWGWGRLPKAKESKSLEKSSKTLPSTPERGRSITFNGMYSPPLPLKTPSPVSNQFMYSNSKDGLVSPTTESTKIFEFESKESIICKNPDDESRKTQHSCENFDPIPFHPSYPTENPPSSTISGRDLNCFNSTILGTSNNPNSKAQDIEVASFSSFSTNDSKITQFDIKIHNQFQESNIIDERLIPDKNPLTQNHPTDESISDNSYGVVLETSRDNGLKINHSEVIISNTSSNKSPNKVLAFQHPSSSEHSKEDPQISEPAKTTPSSVGWQFWWRKSSPGPSSSISPPESNYPSKNINMEKNEHTLRPFYYKSLRLNNEQLSSLNLKRGPNTITFTTSRGATCSSRIFFWPYNSKVVISDVDGTITKSDVLGHLYTMVGKDWTHTGVARLYSSIKANGYEILYLTSRAIGQADYTRIYLKNIEQESFNLPDGPVIMSPDRLLTAFHREVILKRPDEFKIACLKDIRRLFEQSGNSNPFYAGFGNRSTDVLSYLSVGIPSSRIFIINSSGEVYLQNLGTVYQSSYSEMDKLVEHFFPSIENIITKKSSNGSYAAFVHDQWSDLHYWWSSPISLEDTPELILPPSPTFLDQRPSDGSKSPRKITNDVLLINTSIVSSADSPFIDQLSDSPSISQSSFFTTSQDVLQTKQESDVDDDAAEEHPYF